MNSALHENNPNILQLEQKDSRIIVVILAGILLLTFSLPTFLLSPPTAEHFQLQFSENNRLYLLNRASSQSVQFTDGTVKNVPFFFKSLPVNFCDREMLRNVRGIGFSLADAIVKVREEQGAYKTAEDLLSVPGIGKRRMENLRNQFSFVTNLESI